MTPEEEAYCLAKAAVPEHIVSLMTLISQGTAFLSGGYLGFAGESWLIIVGYPLEGPFSGEACGRVVEKAVRTYRPDVLRFIGPGIPSLLQEGCTERLSDRYYLLNLAHGAPKPSLLQTAGRAGERLTVTRERAFSLDHERLVAAFLQRSDMAPRIRALYLAMPGVIGRSPTAWVLSARDRQERLCAFFVVEMGAASFSTYLLGARSPELEAPHASDLLFLEMIRLTRAAGKEVINLGLGVHAGIRRFKEKWGGRPALPYEYCERRYGPQKKHSLLDAFLGRWSLPARPGCFP